HLGHVRQGTSAKDQVRAKPLPDQLPGQGTSEELVDGWDASVLRHLRDIHRGFDAKRRNFSSYELLQQVAVIAGNFDDLAVLIELVFVANLFDISPGVRHPGVGEG